MRLKDKAAIVTGGGHGMGEAEARLSRLRLGHSGDGL
jgi:NAD(P)-dependent dehydrogenase (short-subunit alcohol dehydrogenase family)